MDDSLLLIVLGAALLILVGVIELRIRQYPPATAPPVLRRASIIVTGIALLNLVIAVLLRLV